MHSLQQLLSGGTLAEALTHLETQIKARPGDADLRAAFVQLLCLAGNWQRAQLQLRSWLAMTPQAKPTITLLEQVLEGEQQRAAVFCGQGEPRMPGPEWAWTSTLLRALQAGCRGEHEAAATLRDAAFSAANVGAGTVWLQEQQAEHAFEWLVDGDGRLGPVCELIVNGHYYWLPFAAIAEIRFQSPASVTDLVWRHAQVKLVDGSEQVCQIPVRYPLTPEAEDRLRLGKITEWQPLDQSEHQFIGYGQKVWLNSQAEFSLLDMASLHFTRAGKPDE